MIEINKYTNYKFYWELYSHNHKSNIYIDDKIYYDESIKYLITNNDSWYHRYYELHDKIKFTNELLKFIIENSIYGFLYIYKEDIENKYHNIKISDEIWKFSIQYFNKDLNIEWYEKDVYFYKKVPKNIIDIIKKNNKLIN